MRKTITLLLAILMILSAWTFVPFADEVFTAEKYENGMENWEGSPNKGNRGAATQILFVPYFNGTWRPDLFYVGLPLTVTMESASQKKTFDASIATIYDGGSFGICRIEPCLLEGENKFVPEAGVYYDATFTVTLEGEEFSCTVGDYLLDAEPVDPAKPTVFPADPMYGEIENYGGKTFFIVSAPNASVMEKLRAGEFSMKVTVRDEMSGVTYTIDRYCFDAPSLELYTQSPCFFRIAACEYGIIPEAGRAYTIGIEIFSDGEALYSGVSETGAFDRFNESFLANGPVVPQTVPHPCRVGNGAESYPFDVSRDGTVSILDASVLLDGLSGNTPEAELSDLDADGGISVGDVSCLLDLLSEGVICVRNDADTGWILKYTSYISGDVTIPLSYMGEPITGLSDELFNNCFDLTSVTVPAGVTRIPRYTFTGCASLETLHYGGRESVFRAGGAYLPPECTLICDVEDDLLDLADLSGAKEISDLSGYSTILRVKTTGELLFSPTFKELRDLVSLGHSYDEYLAYLRFSDGERSYPTVTVQPRKSKGSFVDFFLEGNGIDCGFCPTAGVTYEIELVLVSAGDPQTALYYGTYTATAPDSFLESPYYAPTPAVDGQPRPHLLRYIASEGGSIQGAALQYLEPDCGGTEVTAIPEEGYIFLAWSDGKAEATRTEEEIAANTTLTAYFAKVETGNVAAMYIFTGDGRPILQKEYEDATLMIRCASNDKYNVTLPMTIKGRGNSSWNASASQSDYDSKNSYSIKLSEKAQLLGVGDSKSKKWVLNANKFDLSGLRNYLVWELADRMGGTIGYVPECTWVQLYVNMEYRGMYMLTEKIDTGKDRVNVNDDATGDPDKGYLMELDFRGHADTDPWFDIAGYGPDPASDRYSAVEFVIKSEIEGQQDIDFIKDYVQRCHNAIMTGDLDLIDGLVDVASLIDMYILEELSKDCDAGRASFYVCKDRGGKLFFTAPWDFDFGFGTYGPARNTEGLVSQGSDCCTWFAALLHKSWFRNAVRTRMEQLSGALEDTLSAVTSQAQILRADADRNAAFWNLYGRHFHAYVSSSVSTDLDTYDEHVSFIVNWTRNRWQNLYDLYCD